MCSLFSTVSYNMNIFDAILVLYIHACIPRLFFYGMCVLQCLMPMGTLFDVDGLSQLSVSVLVCARHFQPHLTRLVTSVSHSDHSMLDILYNLYIWHAHYINSDHSIHPCYIEWWIIMNNLVNIVSNVVSRDPFPLYIIAASADNAVHQQYLYIFICTM